MTVGLLQIVQDVESHRWYDHRVCALPIVDCVDHLLHAILVTGQVDRQTDAGHHHTAVDHTEDVEQRHRNACGVLVEVLGQAESMAGQERVVDQIAV